LRSEEVSINKINIVTLLREDLSSEKKKKGRRENISGAGFKSSIT
jgi:hypothetical protein